MDGDNKTGNEQIHKTSLIYMYVILYGLTFVFVFTANMMLIYGFYKTSRPFKIVNKLFIYLSISEMVFILCLVLNLVIFTLKGNNNISSYHYIIFYGFVYFMLTVALLVFWTISFLRFLSIFKPMYQMKTRTVYKILTLEALISFLASSVMILGHVLWNSTIKELTKVSSKVGMSFGLMMIFITLSFNMSSFIILRRSTNLKAHQNGDNVLCNPMVVKQKKIALNTLLLITIVQLVCNFPATCMSLFDLEFLLEYNFVHITIISNCLQMSNFGIDSLIVILRTKNLREFYRLKCCSPKFNITNTQDREIQLAEI